MGMRSVVEFTTGPARSGKSYSRCARWLIEEFLPRREGRHISNFPIKFDPWVDVYGVEQPGLVAIAKERLGIDEDEVRERVLVIDPEEMERWRNLRWGGNGRPYGPWFTFAGVDLSGACISIDEVHNYCPDTAAKSLVQEWTAWLGELGHEGCTVEFLSQDETKVHKCIHREAEIRYELLNNDRKTDPLLRIRNYYWRQLFRKLGVKWPQTFWQIEYRREQGKWKEQLPHKYMRADPSLYGVYDSNSQSISGGKAGAGAKEESALYRWPKFFAWFVLDNFYALATRGTLMAAIPLAVVYRGDIADWLMESVTLPTGKAAAVGKRTPGAVSVEAAELDGLPVREQLRKLGVKAPAVDDQDAAVLLAMAKRVNEALDQVDELIASREMESRRAAELEQRLLDATALMAISGDSIVFRGGERYSVGEIIDGGAYQGETLLRVNHDRRTATLESGRVLRLASGADRVQKQPGIIYAAAAGVRGSLPAFSGGGASEPASSSAAAAMPAVSNGRDAHDGVLPDARQRHGNLDRR